MLNISTIRINNNSAEFETALKALEPLQMPYSQIVGLVECSTNIKATRVYEFIAKMATPSASELRRIKILFNILKNENRECSNDCFQPSLTDYADKHGV